ncbi:hypothetical protein F7725_013938 [Dissostichus mawsoni]|uniref:Uncharacterized protein n=1 Tax=Dissostichus mawsoni TaxID=36200 RepID=A0A7J5YUX8_DISMA|nr:hypothetical protein F7725_013938 [Dissostichus mawsoni]
MASRQAILIFSGPALYRECQRNYIMSHHPHLQSLQAPELLNTAFTRQTLDSSRTCFRVSSLISIFLFVLNVHKYGRFLQRPDTPRRM